MRVRSLRSSELRVEECSQIIECVAAFGKQIGEGVPDVDHVFRGVDGGIDTRCLRALYEFDRLVEQGLGGADLHEQRR